MKETEDLPDWIKDPMKEAPELKQTINLDAPSWLKEDAPEKKTRIEQAKSTAKSVASGGKNYLSALGDVAALPFDVIRTPFVLAGTALNAVRGKDNKRNKEKLSAIGNRMFNAVATLTAPVSIVAFGVGAAMGNEKAKEEFGKSRARLAAFATIGAAVLTGGIALAPAAIAGAVAAVPILGPAAAAGVTAASAAMAPAVAAVTAAVAPAVAAVAPVVSAVASMSTTAIVTSIAAGATAGAVVGTALGKGAAFIKNKLSANKANKVDSPPKEAPVKQTPKEQDKSTSIDLDAPAPVVTRQKPTPDRSAPEVEPKKKKLQFAIKPEKQAKKTPTKETLAQAAKALRPPSQDIEWGEFMSATPVQKGNAAITAPSAGGKTPKGQNTGRG